MRVLVTGATGFLGSHLARQLVRRGDEVRVLVRATSDRSRLDGLVLDYVEGDVTDERSVARAVEGTDLVVHCAAVVEFGPRDPARMATINVGGTRHVLGAAARGDILAVYVSSLAALGATPADGPAQDESWWATGPLAATYENQKREAHEHARKLIAGGARIRIAMPAGIYGAGDQSQMYDLIRYFSRYPMLVGYLPEVRQSTVNVEDCANALLRIADEGIDGGEYIVAAGAHTVREWLSFIARGAGHRPPMVYLPTRAVRALAGPSGKVAGWIGRSPTMIPEIVAVATHDSAYRGDKLRRELGWTPRDLQTGMAEMAQQIQAEAAAARAARRAERATARTRRA